MSIILGIDPGTFLTGYGVLEEGEIIDWGLFKPPTRTDPHKRLLIMGEAFRTVLEKYRPNRLAIEQTFVGKYPRTVIALSHLRGVFIFLTKERGIDLEEYSAKEVKNLVTGRGDSDKQMMIHAIANKFDLNPKTLNDNCADAIALAYFSHLLNKQA
ncbi:crossover junction endodeoxyribonuclease RuvC [Candidatus Similichlamydia epinepheli]|uniref:crossover junction endodeoxyribonuclease RuvC n=1 Tax=Candidatus Similichlamydia epinepheli TaxID=1903953 RepID=UPI0013006D29|nr:crossover junction endodeoxyribonuclease RuvC [Candidatus Similichlamydia epinepheli]